MSERSAVSLRVSSQHPRSQLSEVSIPVLAGGIDHCFPASEPWALDIQGRIALPRPSRLPGGGQFPLCTSVEVGVDGEVGPTCEWR